MNNGKQIAQALLKNSRRDLQGYWRALKNPSCRVTDQLYYDTERLIALWYVEPDCNTRHYHEDGTLLFLGQTNAFIKAPQKILFRDWVAEELPIMIDNARDGRYSCY